MENSKQVGVSLASKSPWAIVLTGIIFLGLWLQGLLDIGNSVLAVMAGVCATILLLCYWHGKGGIFFILGLMSPMIAILFAELPNFGALAGVINGFFFGFALALLVYKLLSKA